MNVKKLLFDSIDKVKISYPNPSPDDPQMIRIATNGMELYRSIPNNELNMLNGTTVTPEGATVITGATKATDWEDGKYSVVTESAGTQVVKIALGSGNEFYLNSLTVKTLLKDGDAITASGLKIETSQDDTNYVELPLEISDNIITASSEILVGIYTAYLKFTFKGTTLDANSIDVADIRAYKKQCFTPYMTLEHVDGWKDTALGFVTEVMNVPSNTSIQFQVMKNGNAYYYNGVKWERITKDPNYDFVKSNTPAQINLNLATFPIDPGETFILGIRAVFNNVGYPDLTPALTSVEFG